MKKRYIKLAIADFVVATSFISFLLYFGHLATNSTGTDTLGMFKIAGVVMALIPLIAAIHGVVSQIIARNILVTHLLFSGVYMLATIIYFLISHGDLYGVVGEGTIGMYLFVFFSSLIPALITKLIVYLVEKKKANSQPTTDTME